MIKNIWSHIWNIEQHISWLFTTVPVYAWKPVNKSGLYVWFGLIDNSEWIQTDYMGKTTLTKEAILQFSITGDMDTPDQELYEILDQLSNSIVTSGNISLDWFIIHSIQELWQSGVIREQKNRPHIVWNYIFKYKYYYEN